MPRRLSPEAIEILEGLFADTLFTIMIGMVKAESVEPHYAGIREAAKRLTEDEMRRIAVVAAKHYVMLAKPSPNNLSRPQVEDLKRRALEFALNEEQNEPEAEE